MAEKAVIGEGSQLTFNAKALNAIADAPVEQGIQMISRWLDPKGKRARLFEELTQSRESIKLNPKNEAIQKARKEYHEAMEYNTKLLERGLDPKNPQDAKHFKKLGADTVAAVLASFNL